MPLSEHEERMLAEIERRLAEEDPRFVERARKAGGDAEGTPRLWLSVAAFVLGFVMLFGLTFHLVFGLVGFGLMLASAVSIVLALRDLREGATGSFVERLRRALTREDQSS